MILSLLSAAAIVFGYTNFNEQMSDQEILDMGVDNLTDNQRAALENWIEKHCNQQNLEKQRNTKKLTLSVNLDNGKRLELSDGSIYEIKEQDLPVSSSWIIPFPIAIEESSDPDYPVKIVNTNSNRSVRARKIAQ